MRRLEIGPGDTPPSKTSEAANGALPVTQSEAEQRSQNANDLSVGGKSRTKHDDKTRNDDKTPYRPLSNVLWLLCPQRSIQCSDYSRVGRLIGRFLGRC